MDFSPNCFISADLSELDELAVDLLHGCRPEIFYVIRVNQSQDFRTLIDKVSLQGKGGTTEPWELIILDPAGNDVGVWYSAIRAAAVEIGENGQITKLLPIPSVTKGNQPG